MSVRESSKKFQEMLETGKNNVASNEVKEDSKTSKLGVVGAVGAGVIALGSNAMASTLTIPTIDISEVYGIGSAMLVALAAVWAIRQVLGLLR